MTCRYSRSALGREAARVSLGLAVVLIALLAAGSGFFAWPAALLVLAFAAYGASIALKAFTLIASGERGLAFSRTFLFPAAREIPWDAIRTLRLDFFPERRDRSEGWFRLAVQGDNARIVCDSSLENFAALVGEILERTRQNAIALSPATSHNLKALEPGRGAMPA